MDQHFNAEAAQWAERLVNGLDDESAQTLVTMVTFDVLMSDIANNRRILNSFADEVEGVVAKRLAEALVRSKAGDDEFIIAAALVSKARGGDKYDRDARGRFASTESRGGPNSVGLAERLNSRGRRMGAFQQTWNERASVPGTNARTYQRIEAGSQLLGNIPSSKAKAASEFGQFTGRYGPEAEKVVGPSIRRAAYRYRGTERRVDSELIKTINAQSKRYMEGNKIEALSPEDRQSISRAEIANYLQRKLPSRTLNRLQLSSGKVPPSEGFILNSEGKVITQAVGYADDHYLPFNLKNLQGLKGGSYVRSRAFGGPTTEDIYTGLVSGASSVTVVSHSGVFTINFDENFRGARRYNDKAAQMVSRYAKLLDAINSEKVERAPLSWEDRVQIRDEVESRMKGFDQADIEAEIRNQEQVFRAAPRLTRSDMAEIEDKARAFSEKSTVRGKTTDERYRIARAQLISQKLEEKASNKYRLDAEGYRSALEALREQFPYYIDSIEMYTSRDEGDAENLRFTNSKDTGYVAPRYLRPANAMEGYFDVDVDGAGMERGTGKTPAKYTNYANWRNNPLRTSKTSEPEEDAEESPTGSPRRRAANVIAENKVLAVKDESAKKALKAAITGLSSKVQQDDKEKLSAYTDDGDFDVAWMDPMKRQAMVKAVEDMLGAYGEHADKLTDVSDNLRLYRTMTAAGKAQSFDTESYQLGNSPSTPFAFDGPAYEAAAPDQARQTEWSRLATGWTEGIKMGQLSDAQLRSRATAYGNIADWADRANGGAEPDQETLRMLVQQMGTVGISEDQQTLIVDAILEGNRPVLEGTARSASRAAVNTERMRRLQTNAPSERTTTAETAGNTVRTTTGTLTPKISNEAMLDELDDLSQDLASEGDTSGADTVAEIMGALAGVDPDRVSDRLRSDVQSMIEGLKNKDRVVARLRRGGYSFRSETW